MALSQPAATRRLHTKLVGWPENSPDADRFRAKQAEPRQFIDDWGTRISCFSVRADYYQSHGTGRFRH